MRRGRRWVAPAMAKAPNRISGNPKTAVSEAILRSQDIASSSPPATVEINVSRNFRPPEATAGLAISATEDTPTPLVLEGYDIDGELDTLTFQVVSPPGDGELSGTPPNLTYTPRANFDDVDGFFFTVNDGRFTSTPEEFLIEMIPVNDPPEISLDNESFRAGAGYPFTIQASAIDPEVADGPYSIILDQVTNGVAVRMALLYLVAGGARNADDE